MKRFLVILGERIGDAILVTPALHLLRADQPQATIDLLAWSSGAAEVYQNSPVFNHVFVQPNRATIKRLGKQYDIALVMESVKDRPRYFKWLKMDVHCCECFGSAHQSEVELRFIRHFLGQPAMPAADHYFLYPQAKHDQAIRKLLLQAGTQLTDQEILVGCHMGCFKVAKRAMQFYKKKLRSHRTWPIANYRTLFTMLRQKDERIRFVLTGTEGERRMIQKEFGQHHPWLINLAGKTSVLELAALMPYLRVFITGDTGPMHVAAATNVPMVIMFGSTKPEITGPYHVRPDYHLLLGEDRDVATISVDALYQQVMEVLYGH